MRRSTAAAAAVGSGCSAIWGLYRPLATLSVDGREFGRPHGGPSVASQLSEVAWPVHSSAVLQPKSAVGVHPR
jgi:hypothetical protein